MTQYFYYWKIKNNPKSNWTAYSVAHNLKQCKIVEKAIKKLNNQFDFKKEKGVKPQCQN